MEKQFYLLKKILSFVFTNTKLILFSVTFLLLIQQHIQAQLIIYEPFNYEIGTIQPDPDNGVNGNNGLPYTNNGGVPAGTGVGLRTHFGNDHKVVEGLTYINSGGILATSANALQRFQGSGLAVNDTKIYRNMTTDPFAAFRSQADAQWFGWNAASGPKELYFSLLFKANSIDTGNENGIVFYIGYNNTNQQAKILQVGTDWKYRDPNTSYHLLGPATVNKTEFLVGLITFESPTKIYLDFWFNPTLGAKLGNPNVSRIITDDNWSSGGQFRSIITNNGANIFTYDEFRMGLTAADVMPIATAAAVSNIYATSEFKVYSSAKNTLTVINNKPAAKSRIEVYDTKGVIMYTSDNLQLTNTITLNYKGLCLVKIITDNYTETHKVVVN